MTRRLLSKDFLDERLTPELENGTVQYFDHVRRYLLAQEFIQGKRVLDIACGTGYGGDILQRGGARQVISADISDAALTYGSRQWSAAQFIQADANYIPLPAASLDVVVSFETLEHLAEPRAFLAEVRRILAAGGCLVLSTPNRAVASAGSDIPFSPYHAFEPTLAELNSLLAESGWAILALHGVTHSARAAALTRPARAPFQRQPSRIAWAAYLRLWTRALLPSLVFQWLSRRRRIPQLDIADSVLTCEADESSVYFVAICKPG